MTAATKRLHICLHSFPTDIDIDDMALINARHSFPTDIDGNDMALNSAKPWHF